MTQLGLTINEARTSLKDARKERFDFLGTRSDRTGSRRRGSGAWARARPSGYAALQDQNRRSARARQRGAMGKVEQHASRLVYGELGLISLERLPRSYAP
jgi:RNA-directed DNA polymerase